MSSGHYVVICRNRKTGELKIEPDMTLYELDGAKAVLETVRVQYGFKPDADDWAIELYLPYWEPVEFKDD